MRLISVFSAVVVFITTYALILPAITLELNASCGIEEHQHSEECYEERLICGQEESDGHHHDDSCYEVSRELICETPEHQHSVDNGCFDADGNLICEFAEHVHDDSCYREIKTLVCGREESDGHHHTDACYEKVLVCGKEAHTHSEECYKEDGSEASGDEASNAQGDTAQEAQGAETGETAAVSEEDVISEPYVPELAPLNMEAVLDQSTDFYYFHAEDGEEVPADSSFISDWKHVEKDTELASTDLVRMYLSYSLPAGSLNGTNPVARYRLPGNIHLTDDQIKAINKNENGITAGFDESDPEYSKYLGVEAVEGDRTPDELLQEGKLEYISAVVRAENVYEKDKYIGQDLIFTFIPYTIEKNQITYDAEQNPLSAGEEVTGWFACDFRLDQIEWSEEEIREETEQSLDSDSDSAPDSETASDTASEDASAVESGDESAVESGEESADESGGESAVESGDESAVESGDESAVEPGDASAVESGDESAVESGDGSADESADQSSADTSVVIVEKTAEILFVSENKDKDIKEIKRTLKLVDQKEILLPEEEKTEEEAQEEVQEFQSGTLAADGDGYRITLEYTEEAKIPENAFLSVREITAETDQEAYEACLAQAQQHVDESGEVKATVDSNASRFFDIEILVTNDDGSKQKIEPAAPVSVNIQLADDHAASADTADSESESGDTEHSDPTVLHFAEEGVEQIDSTISNGEAADERDEDSGAASHTADAAAKEDSGKDTRDTFENTETTEIRFEAESFSIYGVVYTVDFYWEVNGRIYKFTLPGGGYVSFEALAEALNIAGSKEQRTDETADRQQAADETADRQQAADETADQTQTTDETTDRGQSEGDLKSEETGEENQGTEPFDLNDIEISEQTKKFVSEVENIEFSDPSLVWVGRIEEDSTVYEIREANQLDAEYSASLTQEQIDAIHQTKVFAGDWAILSLKSFDTEETLTVVMKDGSSFVIKVTDAKDAMTDDNGQVLGIPNPSGTTITLFDYWLDSETENARRGWPGYSRYGTTGRETEFWNYWTNNKHDGTNTGINQNHKLKFVPGSDDTADDYWVTNGNSAGYTQNGRVNGINSWNGSYNDYTHSNVYNGAPTQGIVAGALYNSGGQLDPNGYPRLNLNNGNGNASNRESLDYLFNPGTSHSGKKSYGDVNKLFYVDPDGYYTYESMDYKAKLQSDNTFKLSEQPSSASSEGQIGFWPFDDLNYWLGMHMHVDFSVPVDGQVLNPRGDYMPMQFEFAGDDDAWVYIDGILVADGGGIHNRTEIDLNFKTGHSQVRGGEYSNILQPNEPVVTDKTLYEIFADAHSRGLISNEKWASDYTNTADKTVWIDSDGNGVLDTFAPGTKHTFDFFYLERGGGESNLYIHYNLISTTDFSAHKSYHREDDPATSNVDESRLRRDQFRFELIGYDNPDYASQGAEFVKAIMPDAITWDSSKEPGTFDNPLWNTVPASETTEGYRSLILGNTEDGNINFGNKEISSSYAGKQYKYMVREVVPDNAVNADGVRWADAPEELRREGGFVYNGVMYDAKVFYFIGVVEETSPGSGNYEIKKYRYLDPEYTQPDLDTKFFSFVNGTETPVSLKVIKKSDTEVMLDGAVFSLTRAMQNTDEKWVVREWTINDTVYHSQPVTGTTSDGTLTFSDLAEGDYILEELQAPVGYQMGDQHRWLLTIEKQDSNKKILLMPYITPLDAEGNTVGSRVPLDPPDNENIIEYEVLNGPLPPIDLSIKKQWNDNGDTSVPDGAQATFELHRIKTVPPVKVQLLDSHGEKLSEVPAFVGDTIQIYDNGTNAFRHHTDQPSWQQVQFWGDNTRTASDTLSVNGNDIGWTISTTATFVTAPNYQTAVSSYSVTSNGQYTVNQSDATAGVVQLKLSTSYIGSNRYYFEVPPTLYVSQGAGGSTTADEVISTFTLKAQNGDGDAGNPWKKSFDDLPLVDENGHPYSYYFTEVSHLPANFNVQTVEGNMGSAASPLTESGNIVITNNAPELPRITASKVWLDENGNPIDAESGLDGLEVRLTLYKGTSEAPASEVKTGEVTRTVTGNGTATWFLLDENADVSQYTVKETAVKIPGGDFITIDPSTDDNAFGGQVTGDPSIGFTVANQLPETEIEVTKQWKDGTSANADRVFEEARTISFTVYQKLGDNDGTVYQIEDQPVTGTVTYTPASGETAASWSTETISGLPKYKYSDGNWYELTYYPVETEINGVTITYQSTGGNAVEDPADAAAAAGTVTIINTDIVFPIKIVKIDSETENGLSGAKFQLTRKLAGEGDFTKFVHSSFEEDEDNENRKTGPFTVDSTDGILLEDLLPGEYRIAEKQAPEGYIIDFQPFEFTINADGTISYPGADENELVVILEKDETNPAGLQIANNPGQALPYTGGPGTRLFTILGSILIAGAGILILKKRRVI